LPFDHGVAAERRHECEPLREQRRPTRSIEVIVMLVRLRPIAIAKARASAPLERPRVRGQAATTCLSTVITRSRSATSSLGPTAGTYAYRGRYPFLISWRCSADTFTSG
jgi:hypothetical protein